MKLVCFSLALAAILTQTASAAPQFSGKCAKQAVEAAVNKWADVPNPSESLEYFPVSVKPERAGSATYIVVLAFSDGNEGTYGKYKVVFGDYEKCKKPVVTAE